MEEQRSIIARHLCIVRKLLIDAKYYRNDRASWEEDKSDRLIFIAEANLAEVERLVDRLKSRGEAYG